ncbi:MAG: amidohydrolase family protein, partial [Polyangiaceae bacterium]
RFRADVGIHRGRIAAVASPGLLSAPTTIAAAGAVVAPGFIDLHSHSDWVLPHPDHDTILEPLLAQGVTTIVAGNCGISPAPVTERSTRCLDHASEILRDAELSYEWRTMGDWLDGLASKGVLLNTAMLVGHGTLRQAIMGDEPSEPGPERQRLLREQTRQALREGAYGMSAGLAYAPGVFAKNAELIDLTRVVAEEGGVFTVHGRAYSWVSPFYKPMLLGAPHNLKSVRELIGIARESRSRLQLSHQIFVGRRTWRTYPRVLREIDAAAAAGVDVAFDAFPYTVGNTTVNVLLPDWVLVDFRSRLRDRKVLERLRREHFLFRHALGLEYRDITLLWGGENPELTALEGLDFEAIARNMGLSPFDAYVRVALESDGKARVLIGTYSGDGESEEPLRAVLSHPKCAFETDTILTRRGKHNPASFGTFPRVLGRYSRELGLFSLEEGIRRMTSLPAERIGLKEVGKIAPGHWADLVVLDPQSIADHTGPGRTEAAPSGIRTVMISGEVVMENGARTAGARRGRVMRKS